MLLCFACGWAVVFLPDIVWWPLGALIVAAVLVAALRGGILRLRHTRAPLSEVESPADVRYRLARGLYYAGLLTMPLLALRVHGVTLSDALFLVSLVLALLELAPNRSEAFPRLPDMLVLGVTTLAAGALLSTVLHSANPAGSLAVLGRVIYLLIFWFLLGAIVLRTPQQVRAAIQWWVAGAAICGLYALAQRLGYAPIQAHDVGRFSGLADHVNDLGALSAIAAVPAMLLAYLTRKAVWVGFTVAILVGLMLSGSVGAGIAVVLALVVCTVDERLARAVVVVAVVAASAVAYGSFAGVLGDTPIGRFHETTVENQGTFQGRLEVGEAAWQGIKRDPLVGTGLDSKSASIYSFTNRATLPVHNLFIGRWYDSGLLGLAGIILIVWGWLTAAGTAVIRTAGETHLLAVGLLAATVALLVVAMSEPVLYQRYALAPVGLAIALVAVTQRSTAPARARARARAEPVMPSA